MFSPRIIRERLDKLRRTLIRPIPEHSIAECSKVYEHFRKLTQTDGNRSWYQRPDEQESDFQFVEWEREWITDEMYICAVSFPYWYYRYFFIRDIENRIVRPSMQIAQRIYLDVLADLDDKQLPILLLILKSRQLGMSTITEAVILWIGLFRRGSHNVIASAEEDKSILMSNMIWTGLENLPQWMKPEITKESKKSGVEFGNNGSDITIEHGAQTKGIARGSTPIACHLSELPYFANPIETIESSLLRAMHENRRTFLVLEGTARRKGDWFNLTWDINKKGEATGSNKLTTLFLPWYLARDKYPTDDWLRNHPIPANWVPLKATLEQAAKAALYVSIAPRVKKFMEHDWKMPERQMWYWEFEYKNAQKDAKSWRSFRSEMASDDVTCWASMKESVYSTETLERVKASVDKATYKDYAFTGDGIPKKFQLLSYQSANRRKVIDWITIEGKPRRWELVPLRETPDDPSSNFYLRVFEEPRRGFDYGIGIDIGGGIGRDNSSIDIIRHDPKTGLDKQVAQLYSNWIGSPELPPFCLALGVWYGTFMQPTPEALMCPETQVATGDPISHQLSTEGYTNFHRMHRYDTVVPIGGRKGGRLGWATSGWSRQLMLDEFKQAVENGWLIIQSERTLEEMENQEATEDANGAIVFDHSSSGHDDSIFGTGIAHWCVNDEATMMARLPGVRAPTEAEIEQSTALPPTCESVFAHTLMMEERREIEPDEEGLSYVY